MHNLVYPKEGVMAADGMVTRKSLNYSSGHGNMHETFQECFVEHSKMIRSWFRMKIVWMFRWECL